MIPLRIHHVGVAVDDLDAAVTLYEGLGAELDRKGRQDRQSMDYALMRVGDSEIELLWSADAESAVGKFLARRGPGVHHVAYAVSDVEAAVAELALAGYEMAGSVGIGVHGVPVAFIHPRGMGGVLTELVQEG